MMKTSDLPVLLKSIRSVAAGHYWLESNRVGLLVEVLRDFLPRYQGNTTTSPNDYGLTARELSIIAKITTGRSNKEVGQEFSISERTVKHHLTNIFNKLGVSSRLQLALFAANHHLMSGEVRSLAATVSTPKPRSSNGKALLPHQFGD
jgi:DNA-binding NarL/FixJ family response regulator